MMDETTIQEYIDVEIEHWRENPDNYEHAQGCIHALQNIRVTLYGDMYPCEKCGETEPHGHPAE